ncbi:MAG: oligosaccharide flippase family protein [Elainellaceae cyanobacterium]
MTPSKALTKARLLSGTTWIALAEAIMLPTGFLTVVFLTRQLGPEGYGLFALAATLVTWIEWGINSIFSRTTIKFVGAASDWRAVAAVVLRLQFGCSLLAALALALAAPAIASALNEPALTQLLWLFALEIPLFNLALAHQNILAGLGRFGLRAIAGAGRWVARLLLIVGLVKLGFSTLGAVFGSLGALLVSLIICRCAIRPSIFYPTRFPARQLAGYAVPLFLSALAMRLYGQVDLIALKALGGTAEQAGRYAVAQNLALLGGVLGPALVPVLLTKLSQLSSQEQLQQIRALSRAGMRAVFLHLPIAGIVVGSSSEIVRGLFGNDYALAAPLFSVLFLAAIATVMIVVTSTILIASDRPRWTLAIAAPLLLLALSGHWLFIPRWGETGASVTTLLVALVGALAGLLAVYIRWRVVPPRMTLGRCCLMFAGMWAAAAAWPVSGGLLLLKLPALGLAALLGLWLLGEIDAADRALLRHLVLEKLQKT